MRRNQVEEVLTNTSSISNPKQISFHFETDEVKIGFFSYRYKDTDQNYEISFELSFPLTIPPVFYCKALSKRQLPHIDSAGKICYITETDIQYDIQNEQVVFSYCLNRMLECVEDSFRSEFDDTAYVEEFLDYWRNLPNSCCGYIEKQNMNRPACFYSSIKNNKVLINVVASSGTTNIARQILAETDKIPLRKAFEIQLLLPPVHLLRKFTFSTIVSFIKQNNDSIFEGLKRCRGEALIIFKCKNFEYEYYFGVLFDDIGKSFSSDNTINNVEIHPIYFNRLDSSWLCPRGGALGLESKVMIVGCGSIGGVLIQQLSKIGIEHMTLIDPDKFFAENIYRHVLGATSCNKHKVHEMASYLETMAPFCKVNPIPEKVEKFWKEQKEEFLSHDVIIFCTGDTKLNLYFEKVFLKNCKKQKIIFVWNEPYGIGGHVVSLSPPYTNAGTLQDMYDRYRNIYAFSEEADYRKQVAGCVGKYVQYSFLDSTKSASLVCNEIFNTMATNRYVSWIGDRKSILQAGFSTTSEYDRFVSKGIFEYSIKIPKKVTEGSLK